MATVVVCSRLVHGQYLQLPGRKVLINGQNSTNRHMIEMRGYDGECGYTPMEEAVWNEICHLYRNSPFIKGGFIFAEKTQKSAEAHSAELKNEKIGSEQYELPKAARVE